MKVKWFLLLLVVFLFYSCSQEIKEERFKNQIGLPNEWDSIFVDKQELEFAFPNRNDSLFSINNFLISSDGKRIVFDGSRKEIILFDSLGQFIKNIGKIGGAGPGEIRIPSSNNLAPNNDFYITDVALKRINIFNSPMYNYDTSFTFPINCTNILINKDSSIIGFSNKNQKLLHIFDKHGKRKNRFIMM